MKDEQCPVPGSFFFLGLLLLIELMISFDGEHQLDGHLAFQSGLQSEVDYARTAVTKFLDDFVVADHLGLSGVVGRGRLVS